MFDIKKALYADNADLWDYLFIASLMLTPLFLFVLRGWTNTFGFITTFFALIILFKHASGASLLWDRFAKNIALVFSSLLIVLAIAQCLQHHFDPKLYDGPSRFLLAIPIFMAVRNRKIESGYLLGLALPLSLLILAVCSYWHPNDLWGRATPLYFQDPNIFGIYMAILSFLCLYTLRWDEDHFGLKSLKFAGFIVGILLMVSAGSRSGFLTAFALLALFLLTGILSRKGKWLFLLGLVALITASVFWAGKAELRLNAISYELVSSHAFSESTSPGQHWLMLKAGWHLFLQHPFRGYPDHGLTPFFQDPAIVQLAPKEVLEIMNLAGPHNEFMAYMLYAGVFGILALLLLYFFPLAISLKFYRKNAAYQPLRRACLLVTSLAFGHCVAGFFYQLFALKLGFTFYAVVMGAALGSLVWQVDRLPKD